MEYNYTQWRCIQLTTFMAPHRVFTMQRGLLTWHFEFITARHFSSKFLHSAINPLENVCACRTQVLAKDSTRTVNVGAICWIQFWSENKGNTNSRRIQRQTAVSCETRISWIKLLAQKFEMKTDTTKKKKNLIHKYTSLKLHEIRFIWVDMFNAIAHMHNSHVKFSRPFHNKKKRISQTKNASTKCRFHRVNLIS